MATTARPNRSATAARFCRRLSLAFAAGSFAAAATCLVIWLSDRYDIFDAMGIRLRSRVDWRHLPTLMVIGGAWGAASLLPGLRHPNIRSGLMWSIGPTFTVLVVAFPLKNQGFLGLDMGLFTPILVAALSGVWGMTTALWLRVVGEKT